MSFGLGLGACLGGATRASAQIKPVQGADKLTTYQLGPQIWIRWANRLLTSYRAHPTQKFPYFAPMTGPVSGLSLTSETSLPFPHHRSLFMACEGVNGTNSWFDGLDAGQIVSTGPELGEATPTSVKLRDRCEWKQPNRPAILNDERAMRVDVVGPRLWLIDFTFTWTAVQDVTVADSHHSLFALRAAPDLTPWSGGTLLNSAGQVGGNECRGKPADWCGFFGRRHGCPEDVVEGIAIFDHPDNPWAPCPWFARDYGLISSAPFNFMDEPWTLPEGESVTIRHRVVAHAGDPKEADLDGLHRRWVADTRAS
jgi:hypothetical protein